MAEKERESREVAPYRRRGPVSVFDEMERMFERFMPEWPRAGVWGAPGFPDVDIFERNNHVVVKAELPGVKKEELSVDVTEDEITISGEKKEEEKVQEKDFYRHERRYGSFARTFALPSGVDAANAKASFHDGVLEISVPKRAEAQKRKVKVE